MIRRGLLLLLVFASLAAAVPASAQVTERRDFSSERFRMTPSRLGVIDVEGGRVLSHLAWDLGMHLNYTHDPLVLYRESDGRQIGSLVRNRFGGSLVASLGLFDWVELGIEVPFTLYQERPGNQPNITTAPLGGITSTGFGDLRIAPKVRILRADKQYVDLAIALPFRVPTGFSREYLGDSSVSFNPEIAISRHFLADGRGPKGLVLAANLGVDLRKQARIANQIVESEITYRAGVGFRFKEIGWKPLWLDAGISGSTSLIRPFRHANQQQLEARLQVSYEFGRLLAFAGAGVGILRGYGTPDVRAYLGVRFGDITPAPASGPIADRDNDGIVDESDKCPTEFEPIVEGDPRDGCPVRDSDGDGWDDLKERVVGTSPTDADSDDDGVVDSAELEPSADTDGDGSINALDPDSDNDGLPDGLELGADKPHADCDVSRGLFLPDVDPMTRTNPLKADTDGGSLADGKEDANKNGRVDFGETDPNVAADDVPADRDNDGVPDPVDECPDKAGPASNKGCPQPELVVASAGKLELLEAIRFDTGKDTIRPESFAILDNVVRVLKEHPEILMLRIEGHTDNVGGRTFNQDLSKNRAVAVRRYLAEHGIDESRLVSQGFGQDKPISSNAQPQGRDRNRRVEFVIVEKSK